VRSLSPVTHPKNRKHSGLRHSIRIPAPAPQPPAAQAARQLARTPLTSTSPPPSPAPLARLAILCPTAISDWSRSEPKSDGPRYTPSSPGYTPGPPPVAGASWQWLRQSAPPCTSPGGWAAAGAPLAHRALHPPFLTLWAMGCGGECEEGVDVSGGSGRRPGSVPQEDTWPTQRTPWSE